MSTFVLVTPARGWQWQPVVPSLRAAGNEVFTPTLTGQGERSHLASPETDLDTHVQDIVGVIECEDLSDVVLAGHSYGGVVIGAVAERVPERLALVCRTLVVPRHRDRDSPTSSSAEQARADDLAIRHEVERQLMALGRRPEDVPAREPLFIDDPGPDAKARQNLHVKI